MKPKRENEAFLLKHTELVIITINTEQEQEKLSLLHS